MTVKLSCKLHDRDRREKETAMDITVREDVKLRNDDDHRKTKKCEGLHRS